MLIVGLTGGMACGKSFVAGALRDLGCDVIEADDVGHEVMQPDGEAYAQMSRRSERAFSTNEGAIDRPKLAALVFGDPAQLERLNAIVHPAVRERALSELRGDRRTRPSRGGHICGGDSDRIGRVAGDG